MVQVLYFIAVRPFYSSGGATTHHHWYSISMLCRRGMGEAREIFKNACVTVANSLATDSFHWRKSYLEVVRKDGDLTFSVQFQSSPRN